MSVRDGALCFLSSLESRLLKDRLERGLYVLRDVLDQERPTDPNAIL